MIIILLYTLLNHHYRLANYLAVAAVLSNSVIVLIAH